MGGLLEKAKVNVAGKSTAELLIEEALPTQVKDLKVMTEENKSAIIKKIDDLLVKRRMNVSEKTITQPKISVRERIVILPEALINTEKSTIGTAMVFLATKLGYKVHMIPTPEKLIAISDDSEKIATGILIGCTDFSEKINLTSTSDNVELGRKILRAHQIKSLFNDDKNILGDRALKPNQFFFGNNPGEKKLGRGKIEYRVDYHVKSLPALFEMTDMAASLTNILIVLMNQSRVLLDESILSDEISKSLRSYQEVLTKYCSRNIVTAPATRTNPAKIEVVVPHKPKASSLFTKEENNLIQDFLAPLFTNPEYAKNAETWTYQIYTKGFETTLEHLKVLSNARANVLSKYASLTSKRLREVRKVSPVLALRRKKDIKVEDLRALLDTRKNPILALYRELCIIDPNFVTNMWEPSMKTYIIDDEKSRIEVDTRMKRYSELVEKFELSSAEGYKGKYQKMELKPYRKLLENETVTEFLTNRYKPLEIDDETIDQESNLTEEVYLQPQYTASNQSFQGHGFTTGSKKPNKKQ
jgi:hypothetical protein